MYTIRINHGLHRWRGTGVLTARNVSQPVATVAFLQHKAYHVRSRTLRMKPLRCAAVPVLRYSYKNIVPCVIYIYVPGMCYCA